MWETQDAVNKLANYNKLKNGGWMQELQHVEARNAVRSEINFQRLAFPCVFP